MEEYLKFKEEYNSTRFYSTTSENLDLLKEAYTSHKNYAADTGSTGKNILVEMYTDPSILIGGSSKFLASVGVKNVTRGGVVKGLTEVFSNTGKLKEMIDLTDEVAKKYYRDMNQNIFSVKTRDNAIVENVKNISKELVDRKVLSEDLQSTFEAIAIKSIKDDINTKTFKLIQGAHLLDKGIDKIDTTILKGVFSAPYSGYFAYKELKKSLASTSKYFKRSKLFKDYVARQAATRAKSGIDDVASITDIDKFMSQMRTEFGAEAEVFNTSFKHFHVLLNVLFREIYQKNCITSTSICQYVI